MFGFATRKDVVTGARVVNVTRVTDVIRVIGLAVVIVTVSVSHQGPGADSARGLAIAVTLSLSAAAWIVWMLAEHRPRLNLGSLVVMGWPEACSPGCRQAVLPSPSAARRALARASG